MSDDVVIKITGEQIMEALVSIGELKMDIKYISQSMGRIEEVLTKHAEYDKRIDALEKALASREGKEKEAGNNSKAIAAIVTTVVSSLLAALGYAASGAPSVSP